MEEKQKVLLVGVNLNDEFYFFKSMSELERTCKSMSNATNRKRCAKFKRN